MKKKQKQKSLNSRLWPLYIGYFLQWLVFWFATEKLFMSQIGFSPQWFGINVAIIAIAAVLSEIPSSILADKWSLKGTMVLSSITLCLACFFGYISSDVYSYLISSALWGVFLSLLTGTLEAIIYNSLIDVNRSSKGYEHEYGKLDMISSVALVIGAIGGSIIGQNIGLRETYLYSIPIVLISAFFMATFKQPKKRKAKEDTSTTDYIKSILQIITSDKNLLFITTILTLTLIALNSIAEMRQLLIGALSMPIYFHGMASILAYSAFGFGGYLSRFLKNQNSIFACLIFSALSVVFLVFSKNAYITVFFQFVITVSLYSTSIVLTHKLLKKMPPNKRAGASSVIGIIKQIGIIPITVFYGYIATKTSVFNAMWIFFTIICITLILLIIGSLSNLISHPYAKQD